MSGLLHSEEPWNWNVRIEDPALLLSQALCGNTAELATSVSPTQLEISCPQSLQMRLLAEVT